MGWNSEEEKLNSIWQCSGRLLGSGGIWEKVKVGFAYEEMEESSIPNEVNKISHETKTVKV